MNHDDFRICKHDVALVKWDPEFDMVDSHVPLKPDLYAKENQHCGWNLVRDDFVEFVCTQLAQCRSLEQQQDEYHCWYCRHGQLHTMCTHQSIASSAEGHKVYRTPATEAA